MQETYLEALRIQVQIKLTQNLSIESMLSVKKGQPKNPAQLFKLENFSLPASQKCVAEKVLEIESHSLAADSTTTELLWLANWYSSVAAACQSRFAKVYKFEVA